MNNLSRNRPIALISGVGEFISAHLAQKLLEKKVQVIGIDQSSPKSEVLLAQIVKSEEFHWLKQPTKDQISLSLPRLDYAYFAVNENLETEDYKKSLASFLTEVEKFSPKIVLISSLELYDPKKPTHQNLKWAEVELSNQVRDKKLNARIVRLSTVYGPGMELEGSDPLVKLINLILADKLNQEIIHFDQISRAVFVDDVVNLLLKVVFHGSTAGKIYDGTTAHPLKIHELKQALIDPIWYEKSRFNPSKMAPSPTPNLLKTQRELNWEANAPIISALRQTIGFFHKYPQFDQEQRSDQTLTIQSEPLPQVLNQIKKLEPKLESPKISNFWENPPTPTKSNPKINIWPTIWTILGIILIGYGLLYPAGNILIAGFNLKQEIAGAGQKALAGDLTGSRQSLAQASSQIAWLDSIYQTLLNFWPAEVLPGQKTTLTSLKVDTDQMLSACLNLTQGIENLNQGLQTIKGEGSQDLNSKLILAQTNLAEAERGFEYVIASLSDQTLLNQLPGGLKDRANQVKILAQDYSGQAQSLKMTADLVVALIGSSGEKNYLVVLENNQILRPAGGVVEGVVRVKFKGGKLVDISSYTEEQLDSKVGTTVPSSTPIKAVSGQSYLNFFDVTSDLDSAEASRWISLLYQKATSEKIDGIIILDHDSLEVLVKELAGVKLVSANLEVTGDNLGTAVLDSTDNQIKTETLQEVLNKLIFTQNQNWAKLTEVLSQNLNNKHLIFFSPDLSLATLTQSFTDSFNLTSKLEQGIGEKQEFLEIVESNNTNINIPKLEHKASVSTVIDSSGIVTHSLSLTYSKVQLPSEVNNYKAILVLPREIKLKTASLNNLDIFKKVEVGSYLDNFSTVSTTLDFKPNMADQVLSFEYQDLLPVRFDGDGKLKYILILIKQIGQEDISYNISLSYPQGYQAVSVKSLKPDSQTSASDIFNLSSDQQLEANFRK